MTQKVHDESIESRIADELLWMARDARLDAHTINVETKGTEVTITGTVRSWAEANEACHAVWAVPGVTKVDNRLVVV
jgi:osmotically-inducible protein OsmY